MFCSNCGKKISPKAKACPNCGHPTKSVDLDKNKWVAFLLCWFLGLLGIHRFYMGKNESGVAMLILTLTFFGIFITMIWSIVDLIRILITPQERFNELMNK